MKRKIIKQGQSALTITLPSKWTKKYEIKTGDYIDVDEKGKQLIVSLDKEFSREKIRLDLTGCDHASLVRYISSAYRLGYEEIELVFAPKVIDFKTNEKLDTVKVIQDTVNELIGVEIIDQKENVCTIKDFSSSTTENFDSILRKAFLFLLSSADDSLAATKGREKEKLQNMHYRHKNVRKFAAFCIRYLNRRGHNDFKKTQTYHHITTNIEEGSKVYRYITKEISKTDINFEKETLQIYEDTNKLLSDFYKTFYSFDRESACGIIKRRVEILESINRISKKVSKESAVLLQRLAVMLNIILASTECAIMLNL